MTELRLEDYTIPAADLGPENPLPMFRDPDENGEVKIDASVPEEDARYMGWRTGYRVLPYRMQDGYNRVRVPRTFHAVALENDYLRALFLPELNGRLVSLVYKPDERELLYRNPVFQPANLALRNAWISGGVEWNMGQLGHNYFTCSPVFAARVTAAEGYPVLRVYEWERTKCFPWQIDFHLPPDSPFLFARVRLINPHDTEIAMYWWSNIAVDELPGARVLFPAETCISHNVKGDFATLPLPAANGVDITYPTNAPFACEIFSRIPSGQRPWVTQLGPDGTGLFHTSTSRLKGRKMFCWGMNAGGRRWQEFLAEPGCAYVEIQAGLARTQLESIPMPALAHWTWTEAYGLLQANPAQVHGADWAEARFAAGSAIEERLPQARLDALDTAFAVTTERAPDEILARGAGWGALERRRVAHMNEPDRVPPELVFAETTLGDDQAPWVALLDNGALPECESAADPGQAMIQPAWRKLLEHAVASAHGDHWLAWLHAGVMRLEAGDADGARVAWERSLAHTPNGWALRNLAALAQRTEDDKTARDLLQQAWQTGPKILSLALEYAHALTKIKDDAALDVLLAELPNDIRRHERVRVLSAWAALRRGDLDEVAPVFDLQFASNREGETALTDLWFAMHEQRIARAEGIPVDDALRARVRRECPPPRHIDFRMVAEVK